MADKKKKARKVTLFFTIAFLLVIFVISLLNYEKPVYNTISFDYSVGDKIGINADADELHFGTGLPGSSLQRNLVIESDFDAFISIKSSRKEVYPSEREFFLKAGDSKEINFIASIPKDAQKGIYDGTITIYQGRLNNNG